MTSFDELEIKIDHDLPDACCWTPPAYWAYDVDGAVNDSIKLGDVCDAGTDANNSLTFVWIGSVFWKSGDVCVGVKTDVGS